MIPVDQRAYVRDLETCLREAHRRQTNAPSTLRGQGVPPAPDARNTKKAKMGQGARESARQQGAVPQWRLGSSRTAPTHFQGGRQHSPQRPRPPPYRGNPALHQHHPAHTAQGPRPSQIDAAQGPPVAQG